MAASALEIANSTLSRIMSDLWSYSHVDSPLDDVLQKVLHLKTQLEVQNVLQATVLLLRRRPSNQPLPKQQAVRVKHLMKFVFEKASREKKKQEKLKNLDCNSLVFLGLSYNVKTLYEMRMTQFDFLIDNIGDFIRRHKLNDYLYRSDIDRVVNGQFDAEDDDSLKEFQKNQQSTPSDMRESRKSQRRYTPDTLHRARQGILSSEPPPIDSLTGAAYQLTVKDAQAVTASDQIRGQIWLTNTYNMNFPPFVTIPISQEMSDKFATQLQQIDLSSHNLKFQG
ncbi:hypothetical protein BDBG_03897 [Blastomyces gilchristii SLH14081]|uniref:Uncharacterized protein n=1 Tax=Blastomyces gilchristii (strain SLH14081) TaxID=559298 RepID=A0A179UKX3_BLAGS|nr:uncharacterized protein BDBG_03897 [Blastomyces gilchristii SLH14081]OAT07879.1 hypothetical protein BDBG_03897 [Blastomyces gilchristii SLH14081]